MHPRKKELKFVFEADPASRLAAARSHPLKPFHLLCGCDDPAIISLAFAVARGCAESSLEPVFSATAGSFQSVHTLLAITTYHYTLGFYASADIAARLRAGQPAGWPSSERPDSYVIRRFRNRNRFYVQNALERCLVQIGEAMPSSSLGAVPQLDRLIKAEARFRVHQAELADLESDFQ